MISPVAKVLRDRDIILDAVRGLYDMGDWQVEVTEVEVALRGTANESLGFIRWSETEDDFVWSAE